MVANKNQNQDLSLRIATPLACLKRGGDSNINLEKMECKETQSHLKPTI